MLERLRSGEPAETRTDGDDAMSPAGPIYGVGHGDHVGFPLSVGHSLCRCGQVTYGIRQGIHLGINCRRRTSPCRYPPIQQSHRDCVASDIASVQPVRHKSIRRFVPRSGNLQRYLHGHCRHPDGVAAHSPKAPRPRRGPMASFALASVVANDSDPCRHDGIHGRPPSSPVRLVGPGTATGSESSTKSADLGSDINGWARRPYRGPHSSACNISRSRSVFSGVQAGGCRIAAQPSATSLT